MMNEGKPLTLEDFEDLDEDSKLGVGAAEDFSWKGILDFATCTECGRCQDQCPAWNTEKPLSPKLMIMALRDHTLARRRTCWPMRASGTGSLRATRSWPARSSGPSSGTPVTTGSTCPTAAPVSSTPTCCGPASPAAPAWSSARSTSSTSTTSLTCVATRSSSSRTSPASSTACSRAWRTKGTVEHVRHRADGLGQGPPLRRQGRRQGRGVARRGGVAVLGRLRRCLRGPREEDHPGGRRAPRHGGRRLRRTRQRRDLQR